MVNSVIEDDEDRASLTDRLKRQAPSDSVILTKVCAYMMCLYIDINTFRHVHTYIIAS